MLPFLSTPTAQAVIWSTIALIMCVTAWYILIKLRDGASHDESTIDHLANFREMRAQGVLDPAEFRTIKTSLGEKIRDQIHEEKDPH